MFLLEVIEHALKGSAASLSMFWSTSTVPAVRFRVRQLGDHEGRKLVAIVEVGDGTGAE